MNDGGARAGARAALPYTRISVVVVTEGRTGTAARFGYLGFVDDGVGVVVVIDAFGNFPEKNKVRMCKQSENTQKTTPKKTLTRLGRPIDRPYRRSPRERAPPSAAGRCCGRRYCRYRGYSHLRKCCFFPVCP